MADLYGIGSTTSTTFDHVIEPGYYYEGNVYAEADQDAAALAIVMMALIFIAFIVGYAMGRDEQRQEENTPAQDLEDNTNAHVVTATVVENNIPTATATAVVPPTFHEPAQPVDY